MTKSWRAQVATAASVLDIMSPLQQSLQNEYVQYNSSNVNQVESPIMFLALLIDFGSVFFFFKAVKLIFGYTVRQNEVLLIAKFGTIQPRKKTHSKVNPGST